MGGLSVVSAARRHGKSENRPRFRYLLTHTRPPSLEVLQAAVAAAANALMYICIYDGGGSNGGGVTFSDNNSALPRYSAPAGNAAKMELRYTLKCINHTL